MPHGFGCMIQIQHNGTVCSNHMYLYNIFQNATDKVTHCQTSPDDENYILYCTTNHLEKQAHIITVQNFFFFLLSI